MALYFLHWESKIEILLEDVQKVNVGEFDKCRIYIYIYIYICFYSFYTMFFLMYLSLLEVIFMSLACLRDFLN